MEAINRRQLTLVVAALASVLIGLACADDFTPTQSPARMGAIPARPVHEAGPNRTVSQGPVASEHPKRTRLLAAREKTAWVGQVHSAILDDFLAHKQAILHARPPEACRLIAEGILRQVPRSDAFAQITRSSDEQRHDVYLAVTSQIRACAGLTEASVFGLPASLIATVPQDEGAVTGDFEAYANAVANAVSTSSDGTPASVESVADAALEGATGLGSADFDVVAAVASLSYSSSDYWYNASGGGGGGVFCEVQCNEEYAQSIFAPRRFFWGALLVVVGVDAWGCVAGELSAWHGGHTNESYMYGECGIWGGSASIAAGMGYMK